MREVTERDMRDPKYGRGEPCEFEFRDDGAIVRKDRWEMGIRKIAAILGNSARATFEIAEVVDRVQDMVTWLAEPVRTEEEEDARYADQA